MSHTHEVSWAAGFFDGEGYVSILERSHPFYTGYYLRIGIKHVAIEPLVEMQRLFGGTIQKQNLDKVVGNRKPYHRWVTSTSNAAEALKQMMPYFRNKQKVAAIGLDFQQTIQNHKLKISDETQSKRKSYKELLIHTNSLN